MNVNFWEIGGLFVTLVFFIILYFLRKKHVNFGIRTLIATFFGLVIGLIFKENYTYVAAFSGEYFISFATM